MRLLGLVLALAAIGWAFFEFSGGGENSEGIPEPYRESLEKAEAVEKTLDDSARKTIEQLEEDKP